MPRIKKIKKSELTSIGDEWELVADEDVADSGITLAEDEALVQEVSEEAAPPPTSGDARDQQIASLQRQVSKLNKESASRRIQLKDVTAERDSLRTENATLKTQQSEHALNDKKSKARDLFKEYVTEKKHSFVSDVASTDILEAAFAEIDWTKDVTKEIIGPLVDKALEKKPYVLKTVELPSTEGGKKAPPSPTNVVMDDDFISEVARDFGLAAVPTKKE